MTLGASGHNGHEATGAEQLGKERLGDESTKYSSC